jgi:23S rRNA pseudouridine1911/1915/1917 synthase
MLEVDVAAAGQRLDRFLRERLPNLSRRALADLIQSGAVRVNGRRAAKGELLYLGDRVQTAALPQTEGPSPDPDLTLQICFEDSHFVAVDKPAGIPSHALRAGERGTVASALLARYPEMAGVGFRPLEPGLLHRLDTDTSGILIAARDTETFARLRLAHARGEIKKQYLALCSGQPEPQLARGFLLADRQRVRVSDAPVTGAKPIQTELEPLRVFGPYSLVRVQVAFAGRHQVRAHLAALGHPIVGDQLYGGAQMPSLTRHFLHASEVQLRHPHDGRALQLTAALPAELESLLASLAT